MSPSTTESNSETAFWRHEYERKAASDNPIVQTGRGQKYNTANLLKEIHRAVALLQLERKHTLLDVGCANGLFGIVLSACCGQYVGVEPVEELAKLASQNLAGLKNANVKVAGGDHLQFADNSVDRILMAGVIQLNPSNAVRRMLQEAARVLRKPGRIVLLSVPDRTKQAAFESAYTSQIDAADHLTDGEKKAILDRQANAHWYTAAELTEWAGELGGTARVAELPETAPNRDHRFDFVIDFANKGYVHRCAWCSWEIIPLA